jgi:hypothetical protein
MNTLARFSFCALSAGALVLAATGIGVFAFGTPPMTHWVLMLHIAAAPLFAFGLAAVALTQSANRRNPAANAAYWLVLCTGLAVVISGLAPMTPLFGTEGQRFLYLTHRLSGIALATAIILYFALRNRRLAQSSTAQ